MFAFGFLYLAYIFSDYSFPKIRKDLTISLALKRLFIPLLLLTGLLLSVTPVSAQDIFPATGGENISADNVNGSFTALSNIIIDETSAGQVSAGEFILNVPEGFEWNTALTPSVAIEAATGFSGKGTSLEMEFTSITATQITFTVLSASDQPPNKAGKITISGLAVRPTTGELPNQGNIMASGSSVSNVNDSFGTLKMVAGAPSDVFIESAANGSGSVLTGHNLTAGEALTVYAISRDQGGNFIANVAADSWNLTNINGLSPTPLTIAGDRKSATFSSTLTGSAVLNITKSGLTDHPSGTINVAPDLPAALEIITQPSASNVAGTAFPTQPVLQVKDRFGNVVTTDNITRITASRSAGSGILKSKTGSTTQAASDGIVTFSNLFHTVANDISLSFSADGLPTVTSNTITIDHALAADLVFTRQPPNGARNTPLDPAPQVQVIDAYGNRVDTTGVLVDLNISFTEVNQASISGDQVSTNASGIALFPALTFNKNGSYTLKAGAANLDSSEVSRDLIIADAGQLTNFLIESADDTITAGQSFDIKITALGGQGEVLDGSKGRALFDDKVFIRSSGKLLAGADSTTDAFTNGVLASHTVNIATAGEMTISATGPEGTITSTSDPFIITPAVAFADSSYFTVSNDSLIANGSSTSVITVTLVDQYGNKLISGGDDVTITHTGSGTLSGTVDNGDGTYSAILTAPTDVGSATITASLNGNTVKNQSGATQTEVQYIPGPLATFLIEDTGGNSGAVSNQTAGSPFNLKITAKDADNNTVTSFNGTVEITSGATFISGEGTTPPFTNGVLDSYPVTLRSAGNFRISARQFTIAGESNLFTVSPASADRITSTVTIGSPFLENNGTDTTSVWVQLKDKFGNNLTSQDGNTVNLFFESPASASLSNGGSATYEGNGVFRGILTAGANTIEIVNIIATLNNTAGSSAASDIDTVEVLITEINTWASKSGGNRTGMRDWNLSDNWSLGSIPSINQITEIPTNPANGDHYPVVAQNTTIDFLEIHNEATVNLEPGFTMTFNYDLSGEGTYICDRSTVIIYGNLTVATYASTTCNTTFTGSGEAKITGNALLGNVTIDKDITLTGRMEVMDTLVVTEGSTITIEDGASLDIQGEAQIDGTLVFDGGHLKIGTDVNDSNINISNTTVEFNGTEPQDITGLKDFDDLIINNSDGVTFHNDVVVDDTLFIEEGVLIIDSGFSLVAPEISGNTSNIRMLRALSGEPGWRMIAPPLASTYKDFLDSTVTQGYLNSTLGLQDLNGDSLQPNVLFYNETYAGTDNQRWRAPLDADNPLSPGRGLFVYFFGDVPSDDRYNNPLPDILSIQGPENEGDGTSFTFPVTYTAAADTGWNLVGNPYAATIDWDDGNWIKENMDNVIYVWDPAKNDYQEYNGIDGDPALDDGLIMPFQAFWVKANGNGPPLLQVKEASKTIGGTFYRKSTKKPASIEFKLLADSLEKTSHLTLSLDGKTGKDPRDAYRLLPFDTNTYLELYFTLEDGTELSINNLARKFGKAISIPIHVGGFKNGNPLNGSYTLSWPEFGDVPEAWSLVLEDQHTGKKINLRKNTFYSFDVYQSKQKKPINNTPRNFHLTAGPDTKSKTAARSKPRFILRINPGKDAAGLPSEYKLGINYPNPFTESTTIKFATPLEGQVQIMIYDILGRRVKTILNEDLPADFHEIQWNPRQLASGMYICVMRAGGKQFTRKMTFIK